MTLQEENEKKRDEITKGLETIFDSKFVPFEEELKQTLFGFPPFTLCEEMMETVKKAIPEMKSNDVKNVLKEIMDLVWEVMEIAENQIEKKALAYRIRKGWKFFGPLTEEYLRDQKMMQTITYSLIIANAWRRLVNLVEIQ
jgi:hypothetical protein